MNLFMRLIGVLLFSRFRSRVDIMEECATPFRVWPTDLDALLHMNNGVYLSLQDLARMDYMIRANAFKKLSSRGWYPVVASEMIRFRRSLSLFQKFELRTRLLSWDEKYLYLEHKFISGHEVMALGMIRARFLSRKGGAVSPPELMKALDLDLTPPPFPLSLQEWLAADVHQSKEAGL